MPGFDFTATTRTTGTTVTATMWNTIATADAIVVGATTLT